MYHIRTHAHTQKHASTNKQTHTYTHTHTHTYTHNIQRCHLHFGLEIQLFQGIFPHNLSYPAVSEMVLEDFSKSRDENLATTRTDSALHVSLSDQHRKPSNNNVI